MKIKIKNKRLIATAIAIALLFPAMSFSVASNEKPLIDLIDIPEIRKNDNNPTTSKGLQFQSNELAAQWLLGNQNIDGSFPWTSGGGVYYNVQGPPARGLLKAYEITNDVQYLDAAVLAGNYIINTMLVPNTGLSLYSDGDPRFATHDPIFLEELSQVTGNSSYADFVQTWLWDKFTTGTYGETNDMDANDFGNYVVNARNGQGIVALSPWDISATAIAAYIAGETALTNDLMDSILYGLNQTTSSDTTYDSIGLSGAVWASAITGIDLDPTTGVYVNNDSTSDLALTLSEMRTDDSPKGWLWSSAADPSDYTNGDTQTTAFAIMALDAYDRTTYDDQVTSGVVFIRDIQNVSGEFLGWPSASPGGSGNVEVQGESISGIVTVSPSEVYVDDDWAGSNAGDIVGGHVYGYDAFSYIMDGIDAVTVGGTVYVHDGTYNEQIYIGKSLTLEGLSSFAKPVISAPSSGSRTTYTIFESSRTFDPIVFIDGGIPTISVTMTNFEIDGLNDGGSNTFCGILIRNATELVEFVDLHDLKGTGQETNGIIMYGTGTDMDISDNTVQDFSRNGITVIGGYADITHNTVTGDGPLPSGYWAQNGIEAGWGASASITYNEVSGCSYTGGSWAASGILPYQTSGTIEISYNTLIENQVNVYLANCTANLEGNEIYATSAGTGLMYFYGIIGDPGAPPVIPKYMPFSEGQNQQGRVTYTITCSGNTVESDGLSSGSTGIGIYAGMYGTYDIDFTATYNTVRNWTWGFELYEYAPNNLITADINYNNIIGNTYGVYNYLTTVFDVTCNWWGDVTGPFNDTSNPSGLGDEVTDNVVYTPWLDRPYPDGDCVGGVCADPVWVDDDATSSWYDWDHVASIQTAVDRVCDGGTIYVASGEYSEQVLINKDLYLFGDPGATINAPDVRSTFKVAESSSTWDPIVFAYGGTLSSGNNTVWGMDTITVHIDGFTIDGGNKSGSDRFVGIMCRNVEHDMSEAIISDNTVHSMFDADGAGNGPQTFGIMVYGYSDIIVEQNIVKEFSRGGIGVSGNFGDGDPIADVKDNVVYGNGMEDVENSWWSENGIQFGYGASGYIQNNEVYDCLVNNTDWGTNAIIVVDTNNVIVDNNYVSNSHEAIGAIDFPGSLYGPPWDVYHVSNVTITNNILENNIWGIEVSNDARDITIEYNDIFDTEGDAIDVFSYKEWYPGYDIPSPINVDIHYNNIENCLGDGLWVGGTVTDIVDATCNWWGHITGPYNDSSNPDGQGCSVVGNANVIPWLIDLYPDGDCVGEPESININQSVFDRGFPVRHAADGDWGAAQSFSPTNNVLTRVEIYLRKFGSPEFDLTVELRTGSPEGSLLETVTFTPAEVQSSWQWFSIEFDYITMDPGIDYFIVLPPAPSGVTTSFGYEWGYAFGDQYPGGSFWFTRDGGELWRALPSSYEFVFKTFGMG